MAFEIDRAGHNMSQPSLAEMTRKALQLLSSAPYGFFLMVEGGRIDHAGHMNDPVAAVHDVLAYDEAVSVVLDFARWDGRTAVVSVADHETGGLFQVCPLAPSVPSARLDFTPLGSSIACFPSRRLCLCLLSLLFPGLPSDFPPLLGSPSLGSPLGFNWPLSCFLGPFLPSPGRRFDAGL